MEAGSQWSCREGVSSLAVPKTLAAAFLMLVCLVTVVCGDNGSQVAPSPTSAAPTRAAELTTVPTATAVPVVSERTLPSLRVIHEGKTIEARRYEGCWTPDSSSGLQCVESSPLGEQQSYTEVENGDSIEIEITPDSRPTKLMATMLTQPGEVMASGLLHLSVVKRELVVDMPPGRYNVRLHAQWFEGGSRVPSQGELRVRAHYTWRPRAEGRMLEHGDWRNHGYRPGIAGRPPQNGC